MNFTKIIPIFVIMSFVSGFLGGALGMKYVYAPSGPDGIVYEETVHHVVEESELIDSINEVSPAVVSIIALKDVPVNYQYKLGLDKLFEDPFASPFFGQDFNSDREDIEYEYQQVSGGTGFIVDEKGVVLTNRHVVQDEGADYKVVLSDGSEYDADIVSRDLFDDVAVVQIVADGDAEFPKAEFGDSDALKVGQRVVAIGNALAQYENTVTSGIISAKGRDVSAYNESVGLVQNLSGLLQTDAAINFGNSGGPLVDLSGNVVGMNVAVAQAAKGIGFAIPVDDLKPILKSVQEYGEIVRPVLGVRFIMLTEQQAQEMELSIDNGALLIGNDLDGDPAIISGGAADEAGLKSLDVILKVDGEQVTVDLPLHKLIRSHKPGDSVKLKVLRDGKELDVDVVLKSSQELV